MQVAGDCSVLCTRSWMLPLSRRGKEKRKKRGKGKQKPVGNIAGSTKNLSRFFPLAPNLRASQGEEKGKGEGRKGKKKREEPGA